VVRIHEVGEHDGRPYFSMEYVAGGTLADRLRDAPLAPADAADLVAKLARAVQHAHDRGIVHRDLKPANVLLAADEVVGPAAAGTKPGAADCTPKIADFGLAKHLEGSGDGPGTRSGAILGTPSYMAPEQALGKGKEVGPAADVYALGAILYECLTGRPPFREGSHVDTLVKVVSEDPVPPRQLRPKLPRDLETICQTCLRKEPGKRYATAGGLADDLDRFAAGLPIAARPRTVRERVGGWARRRREYLFLAAGVLLAAGIALPFVSRGRVRTLVEIDRPAVLPPDLRLVPPAAFAFATVRPADLWAIAPLRDVIDHRVGQIEAGWNTEALARAVEDMTSVHPRDIERATAVLPDHTGTGPPLVLLWMSEPYSRDRLHEMLVRRGTHVVQDVGGKRMYAPSGPRGADLAFLAAGDRLLVLGDPDLVYRAATAPPTGAGPLTPILEQVESGGTLVAGVNPPPELVAEWLGGRLRLDPRADAVGSLRTIGLAASAVQVEAGGRLEVHVRGRVTFPSPDRAAAARPLMTGVVDRLVGHLTADPDSFPPAVVDPLLAPVRTAAWEQEGGALAAAARVEFDPARLKAGLTEWHTGGQSAANLRRIARAMRDYHAKHGKFPSAVVADADGKPLYSWRVLLLPHLGEEFLYRRFHLNRAWDHPTNRPLLHAMPRVFAAPNAPAGTNVTPYQVLTGAGGLFDSPDGRGLGEMTDPAARTLLVVEAKEPVPWSRPADAEVGPDVVPKLGGVVPFGFHAAAADGGVGFLPHDRATPALVRGLFTRSGGEPVAFPVRP
jgi:hypothetical protein